MFGKGKERFFLLLLYLFPLVKEPFYNNTFLLVIDCNLISA